MNQPNPEQVQDALKAAVAAIYFDDSSDFKKALFEVIKNLGGQELADLAFDDSAQAYAKVNKTQITES